MLINVVTVFSDGISVKDWIFSICVQKELVDEPFNINSIDGAIRVRKICLGRTLLVVRLSGNVAQIREISSAILIQEIILFYRR